LSIDVLAFSVHLIPAMVIIGALVVAWRWELVGTGLFALIAASYALHMLSRNMDNWVAAMGFRFRCR
jgi:hypothetical protein